MGSGKTTLGSRLAAHWKCPFIDLDQVVAERAGDGIRAIMQQEGEVGFRRRELQALQEVAQQRTPRRVLATGGGLVETDAARRLLPALGTVVWLRADPQRCVERLGPARLERPLLDGEEVWRQRWERRQPLYERLAEIIVDTEDVSVEASLKQLLSALRGSHPGPDADDPNDQ